MRIATEWSSKCKTFRTSQRKRYDSISAIYEKRRTQVHNRECGKLCVWFCQTTNYPWVMPRLWNGDQCIFWFSTIWWKQFRPLTLHTAFTGGRFILLCPFTLPLLPTAWITAQSLQLSYKWYRNPQNFLIVKYQRLILHWKYGTGAASAEAAPVILLAVPGGFDHLNG